MLPFFLSFIGCNRFDEQLLVGKWQASAITEDGQVVDIDYSPVNFEFTNSGNYTFNSTIEYKEAGSYYVSGDLLFTTDTLNTASTEKAVQIANLTQDSLKLIMEANGKPKVMELYKLDR